MRNINNLYLSYPDFREFDIIDPNEANQNNEELTIKINEIIDYFNPVISDEGAKFINLPPIEGIEGDNVYDTLVRTAEFLDSNYERLETHRESSDHDSRYYTKDELQPYLRGGDTIIQEEVFYVISADNDDGTFTYITNGEEVYGELTEEGHQVFTITRGTFAMGMNRVEVIIDDALRRSVSSGGVRELSRNAVALTSPVEPGTEITVKYYERIGVAVEYNINLGSTKPVRGSGNTMWFRILNTV